ncbi:major facilitator family transporter [Corallococcus coralloides DSM 2259]|uniref:Major facilitator family transporter n=1 Tax=Corallococcus coralloides (strain ATCC 25202 / DSM 2259 / NBRC 100086 / M2) TaxID=1144275 RepID=H8MZZ3_CORCM|nr:MFS transporter [Corallococcus coralloides]AFE10843.1 major facilitator family transporter [Corallococcus coralloides DSM 2259]
MKTQDVGRALLALSLGGFGIGTTEFATMGILPQIASGLGTTIPRSGHVIAAYALGVVVGAPLVAIITARMSRRALLLLLMVAFTLGNTASALAPTIETLIAARFMAGLPHGAYFGVASVVGAELLGAGRKGRAVALIMAGLTVANIIGVPAATFLGQQLGWRSTFLLVGAIGLVTLLALWLWVPHVASLGGSSIRQELSALKQPQVWWTSLVGAVGFGGLFAVYSYIAPTLTFASGMTESALPWVLALFGVGMTVGAFLGGRLTDHSVTLAMWVGFAATTVVMVLFALTAQSPWAAVPLVFLIGVAAQFLAPAVQVRLMEASPGAPSLAASMSHSALNIANAAGAWVGGLVIAAGWGYLAPAWAAVAMTLVGAALFAIANRGAPSPAPARAGPA